VIEFDWDERKRLANVRSHGIDFRDLPDVFAGFTLTYEDLRFRYDEHRYITIGMLSRTVLLIAHNEDEGGIRIIHARKASRKTAERYFRERAGHAGTAGFKTGTR
jgi:uncharacterized protein